MSETLKVTHVVLSLDVGGLERNIINQIREGQRLGQTVSVVCMERPGTLASLATSYGAKLICLDKRPGFRLEMINRMRRALQILQPDVVHTHQIGPLFYTGPAARRVGIPLVVHTEHGKEDYSKLRLRWLTRMASRYAARFYCLTVDMAAEVIAHRVVARRKVTVIRNGIDTDCFRAPCDPIAIRRELNIPLAAPLVGTVGRLNEIKRQDRLLRAFAQVRTQLPDAYLLLVGDGPLFESLRDQASSLGIGERVRFAGYQPRITPYLRAMDVFALTSRSEGMPQAVLEACVVGVPVIATAVGGVPEVIEHGRTGLLVDQGDESALATGLLEILTNRTKAQRMCTAAQELVEMQFSVRRMAEEYHSHFQGLLGARMRGLQRV
jgi:sugar transferase (PEP-CTERM/EpsH1 system associated)